MELTRALESILYSVQAVGKSGRDTVYLDNVSFRVSSFPCQNPIGVNMEAVLDRLESLNEYIPELDPEKQEVIFQPNGLGQTLCCIFQIVDHTTGGPHFDMTVTIGNIDVANELATEALVAILWLRQTAEKYGLMPGRVTFNIANAFVLWEDIEVWDEHIIDLPM